MGFLDNLKDKAEEFGEKAKDGLDAARDKAAGFVDDVKDKMDRDDDTPGETSVPAAPAEPVASDYSPEAVEEASFGINDAVTDATETVDTSAANAADTGLDPFGEPSQATEVGYDETLTTPQVKTDSDSA
jgi:hypothetical protein